jgi:hypothetical protein
VPPVSTTPAIPVANLLPVSLIPVVHFDLTWHYFPEFSKKFQMNLMLFSWGLEEDDSWKNMKQNSRDTVPLNSQPLTVGDDRRHVVQ